MPLESHPTNSMRIYPGHYFGWFEPSILADLIKRWTSALVIQLIKGRFGNAQKFGGLITRPEAVWNLVGVNAHMKNFFLL